GRPREGPRGFFPRAPGPARARERARPQRFHQRNGSALLRSRIQKGRESCASFIAGHALMDRCLLPEKWKAVFLKERYLQTAESQEGGLESALPCLMHASGYAVAAIGFHRCRATAEPAEQHHGRDERKYDGSHNRFPFP